MSKFKKSVFWICIFIGLFVFFSYVHPVYLFDTDDWNNISARRFGLPLWGWWNPSKVLPEVLMSYAGDFGVWFIKPFVGNYIISLMIACALVYSFIITLYFYGMSAVTEVKLGLKGAKNYVLTLLMVLLHFLVFKKQSEGNAHFFYATNLTCIFNYVIPALLCATLVMYLIRTDIKKLNVLQRGFLVLATYLCVFSNLFDSVILVSYAGVCLLKALFAEIRQNDRPLTKGSASKSTERLSELDVTLSATQASKKLSSCSNSNFVINQSYYLLVLVLFLIQCIFELSGGRAADMRTGVQLGVTVQAYLSWLRRLNGLCVLMAAGLVAFFVCYCIFLARRSKGMTVRAAGVSFEEKESAAPEVKTQDIQQEEITKDEIRKTEPKTLEAKAKDSCTSEIRNLLLISISCFALTSLALIALCSVVASSYIARTDVFISALFYIFLMLMLMAAYLLRKLPGLFLVVPLVCFVTLTIVTNGLRIFAESNMKNLPSREVLAIDRDLVRQVVEADAAGAEEVDLHVPKWDSEDNWPHAIYAGKHMANTLYRHGITNKLMTITFVPDADYEPERPAGE